MSRTARWWIVLTVLALALPIVPARGFASGGGRGSRGDHHIKRVLFISVDGMHALDLSNYVRDHPDSTLAKLSAHGVTYTQSWTSKPSDSFPGTIAEFTGGSPISTGVWYCLSYDRKLSPPHSKCATLGTPVLYDQRMDYNPHALDAGGGLDPSKLPLDPARGCRPVYPHQYLRVNTIFEVAKAHGLRTAWSDKHPVYDVVNGPSGHGVDDLFNPEISADAGGGKNYQSSVALTEKYDEIKVRATLNQIAGKDHTGQHVVGVPAIFGMNFQVVNTGQKKAPGGYQDSIGTPTPPLADAFKFVDTSLGRMVDALAARHLLSSTLIIVTAKHGNAPIDPLQYRRVSPTPSDIVEKMGDAGFARQLGISVLWLRHQDRTREIVSKFYKPETWAALVISNIYSGPSLELFANDPAQDSRVPDIIIEPRTGVDYSGIAANIAEHGGFNVEDRNVALLVADYGNPTMAGQVLKTSVDATQLAPTMAIALGLDPLQLQSVRKEKTMPLPEF
jgi:Type I phosphodiesterase / nucleotide pyrophosphatase